MRAGFVKTIGLFVALSFALSGVGLLGFLFVLVEALVKRDLPAGWASTMSAVALLAGVQLLILGVMGEYLGRMFLTANQKPQYVVREVIERGEDGR